MQFAQVWLVYLIFLSCVALKDSSNLEDLLDDFCTFYVAGKYDTYSLI